MNGLNYLLDTNFILGLLKSSPETLALINDRQVCAHQCAYSAITRMELLGFPGITRAEESLIQNKLERLIVSTDYHSRRRCSDTSTPHTQSKAS